MQTNKQKSRSYFEQNRKNFCFCRKRRQKQLKSDLNKKKINRSYTDDAPKQ